MVEVGDRIVVESERVGQPPRTGVVTAVHGLVLEVHWDSGNDSTFIPSGGSMDVRGHEAPPAPSP